jgi:hypothetical protein
MDRVCTKCGGSEPKVTFAAQRRQCKECRKGYLREYYAKNETYFADYRHENAKKIGQKSVRCQQRSKHERYNSIQILKSAPCQDCSRSFPFYVMDFDHRDPSLKVAGISTMVKTYVPWPKVLEEIAKCDLLCACCHRLRTYTGDSNYRSAMFKRNRVLIDRLKTAPCTDCNGVFKPCQMDFDHVRGNKHGTISQMLALPEAIVIHEINKCELVCANCHRIRTYERPSSEASKRLVLQPEETSRARERYVRMSA